MVGIVITHPGGGAVSTDAEAVHRLLGVVRDSRLGGTFLERMTAISEGIRRVVPVSKVTAIVLDPKEQAPPPLRHMLSIDIDPCFAAEFAERWAQVDPALAVAKERPLVPVQYSSFFSDAKWGRDGMSDFLGRSDTRYGIGCSVPLPRGLVLSFCLHREPALGDFTKAEADVLALLFPDLGRAAFGALLEERLAGLNVPGEDKDTHAGLIVLDGKGDVVHADASALAAIQQVQMVEGLFADVLVAGAQALAGPGPPWTIERSLPLRGGGWLSVSFSRVGGAGGVAALVRASPKQSPDDSEGVAERAGLSKREREVALLAVTGLANRAIAARLGLSPITVKLHLSHVFKKTGVLGRTELAALFLGGLARS
jgi:DNA-binding CsgD family transcriptional regulator